MKVKNNIKKKYFTTGDIARYCEVDVNTVKRWIRQGSLKAFSTPAGHYRVDRKQFITFIKQQGFYYDIKYFGDEINGIDIMIIEDDPTQLELFILLLKNFSDRFHIETSTNGFDGFLKIHKLKPKLIILDFKLPGLTGLELIKVIRSRPEMADTKIIVISAYLNNEEITDSFKKLNIDGLIYKPVEKKQLIDLCMTLLEMPTVAD